MTVIGEVRVGAGGCSPQLQYLNTAEVAGNCSPVCKQDAEVTICRMIPTCLKDYK